MQIAFKSKALPYLSIAMLLTVLFQAFHLNRKAEDKTERHDKFRGNTDNVMCGPRCVHFVLKMSGHNNTLYEVVDKMFGKISKNGVNFSDIRSILTEHGVQCTGSWEEKYSSNVDCRYAIIHCFNERGKGHFCVIHGDDIPTLGHREVKIVFNGLIPGRDPQAPWIWSGGVLLIH